MINNYERLLTTYAYNILGSYEDAKDVVQDVYLKFIEGDHDSIEDKKAYLVRMVINFSINRKTRQRRQRSLYPGEWLPEPIATERADAAINRKEILSYSLMVLLEKLNAKQRAVFILKEAFAYDHREIAEVLDITEEHSRKLLSRAKEELKTIEPAAAPKEGMALVEKYLSAIQHADMHQLEQILHDDVVVISDGGGKATAFRNPILGRTPVTKLLLGIFSKFYSNVLTRNIFINHEPAICYYVDGKLVTCQVFSIQKNGVEHIYFMRNPDKLKILEKNLAEAVTS